MAENEKCFCHFGEYEVKDARARKSIEEIMRDYPFVMNFVIAFSQLAENPENEGKVIGIMGEQIVVMDAPAGTDDALQQTVEQHSTQINMIANEIATINAAIGADKNDLAEHKTAYQLHVESNDTTLQAHHEQITQNTADIAALRTYVNEQIGAALEGSY